MPARNISMPEEGWRYKTLMKDLDDLLNVSSLSDDEVEDLLRIQIFNTEYAVLTIFGMMEGPMDHDEAMENPEKYPRLALLLYSLGPIGRLESELMNRNLLKEFYDYAPMVDYENKTMKIYPDYISRIDHLIDMQANGCFTDMDSVMKIRNDCFQKESEAGKKAEENAEKALS